MAKFRLMWENNPDTPITAQTLSEVTENGSEPGGILYKDVDELLPNGVYNDGLLKLRANSRVLLKSYNTRALFFNAPGTLVSHNSQFGPTVQDNVVFLKDSLSQTNSIYAGEGTTNLFSNPGFEDGFGTEWSEIYDSQLPAGIESDPNYGEEYNATVEIVSPGFESPQCVRMYNGYFGRTEMLRGFDLTGIPTISISFYYKSTGGLRCLINSGSLYWKLNDWNPSAVYYELPSTDGEWRRFEIKNISTAKIQTTINNVNIVIYSETEQDEHFIDSFQAEEHSFCSPYTDGTRGNSLLKYSPNIANGERGYVDITMYPRNTNDFTVFSIASDLAQNVVELIYNSSLDQFQLRVYDIVDEEYKVVGTAGRLGEYVDSWIRVICGWDKDLGLKIITTASPYIESNTETFTPMGVERIQSFDIASNRGSSFGNFFTDLFKINTELKDDVEMMRDFQKMFTTIDEDYHKVFYIGEEAVILDESMLETGSFEPNTSYFVWVVDDLNDDTGSIIITKNSEGPQGYNDKKILTRFAGFKTDDNSSPEVSSLWDITTRRDRRIHTERLLIHGVDSDDYNFDVRTFPYAEVSDVRSTIPIHFSNNLYGRHSADTDNQEVQYFEVNNQGWVGVDNIQMDGNTITTRNYPDNDGVVNNNLVITTTEEDNASKVWIHAHEVDIDSGNRDIKLDSIRVSDNIIYTKELTDLHIDVSHTDNPTNRNDIYLKGHDIFIQPTNDLAFDVNADFTIDTGGDFIVSTNGTITLDDIHIDNYDIYNDSNDVHIYSTSNNVDIDSGSSGVISLDEILVKDELIYRDSGNIRIETPDDIVIGRSGTGTDPHATNVVIRSDNFKVESQSIEFTNVDAADFINFDELKIRQSELYTENSTQLNINGSGNLRLHSDANVYLNSPNNVEIQDTTNGKFISQVESIFMKDVYTHSNIVLTNSTNINAANIFASSGDANNKVVIEHKSNNAIEVSNQGIRIIGDLIIEGTQTTVNSTDTEISDNTLVINKSETTPVSRDSAFEVERNGDNARLYWHESMNYWQVDNGDNVLRNIIFNGYDERFAENVNIVTTEPAGFKLENDLSVGGMELLNPDQYTGMAAGEAIMNVGLHMNQPGGYIKDKLQSSNPNVYEPGSVGAWMEIDTRASNKSFSWIWEEPSTSVEKRLLTLDSDSTMTLRAGDAGVARFEAIGDNQGTGDIYVGQSVDHGAGLMYNGDDNPDLIGTADQIIFYRRNAGTDTAIFTGHINSDDLTFSGNITINSNAVVDNNATIGGNVTISGTELSINGASMHSDSVDPTGTERLNYDGYFYATRVYNAVYNDLAEFFLSEDKPEPGKVYKFNSNGKLEISNKRADSKVAGVCSDTPAFVMKTEYEKQGGVPIALAGSVDVWVRGRIKIGDELVGDKNGFATKAKWYDKVFNRSAIIGRVIKTYPDKQEKVLMFIKNG